MVFSRDDLGAIGTNFQHPKENNQDKKEEENSQKSAEQSVINNITVNCGCCDKNSQKSYLRETADFATKTAIISAAVIACSYYMGISSIVSSVAPIIIKHYVTNQAVNTLIGSSSSLTNTNVISTGTAAGANIVVNAFSQNDPITQSIKDATEEFSYSSFAVTLLSQAYYLQAAAQTIPKLLESYMGTIPYYAGTAAAALVPTMLKAGGGLSSGITQITGNVHGFASR
jgi:hypothetical protein